jgi:protein involved in polysaccharide export with SLBB domain
MLNLFSQRLSLIALAASLSTGAQAQGIALGITSSVGTAGAAGITTGTVASDTTAATMPTKSLPTNNAKTPNARSATQATTPDANKTANDSPQPPAAEIVKDSAADDIEFQRFVRNATGQSLKLYGFDLFARSNNFSPVQAAPVPSSYVLGPGDELVVQINGLVELNTNMVIDRDGRVMVPKVGPLSLAGVPMSQVEKILADHMGKVYRNFTVSVTLGRLRSIEVFVVGQANKPGKYLVSSLSSLINALFETGGPSANGSLRAIELRREGKTIATVDMYAFLARGDNTADVKLMAGDIIFIPAAGARAAVLGTINAPAIYELRVGETINNILGMSGGLPTLAAPQKAQLERLDATRDIARYIEDFALDAKGLNQALKAGDILTVFQISPQIANAVTLAGNVAAPLRYTFKPGMRVADLLNDKRLLIPGSYWLEINKGSTTGNYSRPEVNLDYATIQRLDPLTLRTKTIAFNLSQAIALDERDNLKLASGDIVTVYKPSDAGPETENSITVTGEIVGGIKRFAWRQGFTVKDIIPSTQFLIDQYSYWQRPSAKSLRNDINWDYAQIIRRVPKTLSTEALTFNLGQAVLKGNPADNLALEAGDQIALFTTSQIALPVGKRIQMVNVSGEVQIPGQYQVQPGETLEKLLKRAGGLTQQAFPYGMVFSRESTRTQQQDNLNKSVRRIEADILSQTSTAAQNATDLNSGNALQMQIAAQRAMLTRLQSLKANGRIALELDHLRPVLPEIVLEDGDQITVPSQPSFVGVFGEVFSENSFIYKPGYSVSDYLKKSGTTRDADTDNLLLIRADGTIENNAQTFSFLSSGVMGKRLYPGDTIFVPGIIDRRTAYSQFIQGAKDWTTILYQFGLGAAALKAIRN